MNILFDYWKFENIEDESCFIKAVESNHSVIIIGNPGTGKTLLSERIKALCNDESVLFGEVTEDNLHELKDLWDNAIQVICSMTFDFIVNTYIIYPYDFCAIKICNKRVGIKTLEIINSYYVMFLCFCLTPEEALCLGNSFCNNSLYLRVSAESRQHYDTFKDYIDYYFIIKTSYYTEEENENGEEEFDLGHEGLVIHIESSDRSSSGIRLCIIPFTKFSIVKSLVNDFDTCVEIFKWLKIRGDLLFVGYEIEKIVDTCEKLLEISMHVIDTIEPLCNNSVQSGIPILFNWTSKKLNINKFLNLARNRSGQLFISVPIDYLSCESEEKLSKHFLIVKRC